MDNSVSRLPVAIYLDPDGCDPFSLLLARAANLVVDDATFAGDLRQRLQQAIGQSATLDPAHWQRRAWPRCMLSWLAYESVRLMVGLAGGGRWV